MDQGYQRPGKPGIPGKVMEFCEGVNYSRIVILGFDQRHKIMGWLKSSCDNIQFSVDFNGREGLVNIQCGDDIYFEQGDTLKCHPKFANVFLITHIFRLSLYLLGMKCPFLPPPLPQFTPMTVAITLG